ncbi:MAG: hypothetical protein LBK53_01705 [Heliobacteriaceae bacterium]|nr:hypothetical protein [Heliobacteriaceae bacterium]
MRGDKSDNKYKNFNGNTPSAVAGQSVYKIIVKVLKGSAKAVFRQL